MFCKLVEHVPGRRINNPQCGVCDANSANERGNWILERSLDGVTFDPWQYYAISDSECLSRYNIAPRRGAPTYRSDQEVICTSYYSRLVPLEHGEVPVCLSLCLSVPLPVSLLVFNVNNICVCVQIHTSLINGRPGADDLTPELLDFTSARYIRLRLQRIRTLNADLMTLSYKDPKEVDPIVTRRRDDP
ncbi:hypothetical protein CRUP_001243 [Coryphaenoides rupestris]|nr:hypothetical protein CRUP_001243 [Coryphaenoides rupestris]